MKDTKSSIIDTKGHRQTISSIRTLKDIEFSFVVIDNFSNWIAFIIGIIVAIAMLFQ